MCEDLKLLVALGGRGTGGRGGGGEAGGGGGGREGRGGGGNVCVCARAYVSR